MLWGCAWGNFLKKVSPNPFKNFCTGGLGGVCAIPGYQMGAIQSPGKSFATSHARYSGVLGVDFLLVCCLFFFAEKFLGWGVGKDFFQKVLPHRTPINQVRLTHFFISEDSMIASSRRSLTTPSLMSAFRPSPQPFRTSAKDCI